MMNVKGEKMKLHEKIRKIRKDLGLSMRDVQERLKFFFGPKKAISYPTLVRIENGKISKFSSILQIRYALGVTIDQLLKDTELEERLVIEKDERINEYTYNEKANASVVIGPNASFLALELTLEPSGRTTLEQSPANGGKFEKWFYVIQGTLHCYLNNEEYILKSKDTLTFNSTIPHYLENKGKTKCICIVIQNPKHF